MKTALAGPVRNRITTPSASNSSSLPPCSERLSRNAFLRAYVAVTDRSFLRYLHLYRPLVPARRSGLFRYSYYRKTNGRRSAVRNRGWSPYPHHNTFIADNYVLLITIRRNQRYQRAHAQYVLRKSSDHSQPYSARSDRQSLKARFYRWNSCQ